MSRQVTAKLVITAEDLSAAGFASVAKRLGEVEQNTSKTARALAKLPVAIKVADVAVNALGHATQLAVGYMQGMITEMSSLQDASDRFGVSAQSFSRYRFAAQQTGTELSALEAGFAKLSRGVVDNDKKFAAWGIRTRDARGHTLSLDAVLAQIPTRMSSLQDGAQRAAMAQDLLGKSGVKLVPVMSQYTELARVADELGITVSDSTVRAFDDFGDTVDQVKGAVVGLIRDFAAEALPTLKAGADQLLSAVRSMREAGSFEGLKKMADDATRILAAMIGIAANAVNVADKAAQFIGASSFADFVTGAIEGTEKFADDLTRLVGLAGPGSQTAAELEKIAAAMRAVTDASKEKAGWSSAFDDWAAPSTKTGGKRLAKRRTETVDTFGPTGDDFRNHERLMMDAYKREAAMERARASDIRRIRDQSEKATRANTINSMKEELAQRRKWADFVQGPMTMAAIGLKNAFVDAFTGAKDFGTALLDLMGAIVNTIVDSLLQMGVQWLISSVLFKTTQLEQALFAIQAAAASASAQAFAAYAWIPVAGPALGASAAAGAYGGTIGAGLAALPKFEQGGEILNTGLATVHRGEVVIPAPVVNAVKQDQSMGSSARAARGNGGALNLTLQSTGPLNRGEVRRYLRDVVVPELKAIGAI